jgi:hypothetical protein
MTLWPPPLADVAATHRVRPLYPQKRTLGRIREMSFKGQEEISSLAPALVNSSGDGGRLQRSVPLRGRPAGEVIALLYK